MIIVIAQNIYAENGFREKLSPWLRQQCIAVEHASRRASLSTSTETAGETISCMMVLVESADGEASIRRAGGVPLGYADPA